LHEAAPAAGLAVHEQSARMMPERAITVVDDDESIRDSLPALLQSYGYQASAFESAEAFLEAGEAERTACLILDVAMPGMSGPELQQALSTSGYRIPIIFISARSQDEIWPRLQASGAIACLLKPFSENAMLEAVRLAFDDSRSS
jgi:FixJ family two-component response regulator